MEEEPEFSPLKNKTVWAICYCAAKDTQLECLSICQECLLSWISLRITKDLLKEDIVIPCPNSTCEHQLSISDMQANFSRERMATIMDKLLDVYMCNAKDVRKCPNARWSNGGVIVTKPCRQQLTCELCEYKWKDVTQYTIMDKLANLCWGKCTLNSEYLSYFSEVMRGEPCPQCGIVIIKTGGCPHILWQKCSYEFCWDWLGYYKDYKHMSDTTCPLRVFILYPFMIYFLANINFKLCYSFTALANIEKFVVYSLILLLIWVLILASFFIELMLIRRHRKLTRQSSRFTKKKIRFNTIAIWVYPIIWLILMICVFSNKSIYSSVSFMISEVVRILHGRA